MVTLYDHIPRYLTSFVFHHTKWLVIIPFLTSAQVMLTAGRPVDQPGNIVVPSLVVFRCQVLALTNNVIYCFNLFATQLTKWGLHWLVDVELSRVCSQCLFLGCKIKWFSFNFQITFPSPLPGLNFINRLRHFPLELAKRSSSDHLIKVAFCLSRLNSSFSCAPSLFKIFVFLAPSNNLSFEFLINHAKLFSSAFTHISQIINTLPPFCRGRYNRSTSLCGCKAACNVIIFLVFLSNSCNSSTFQSTTPALYLRVATAHVLTATILSFPLNFAFSTYLSLRLYSFENGSFVSFSFNRSVSRIPKYLYQSPS